MVIFSLILSLFYIIFFSFFKPIEKYDSAESNINIKNICLYINDILPYIILSLFWLYNLIINKFIIIDVILYLIWLMIIFFWYLNIWKIFIKKKLNVSEYYYQLIKNKKEIKYNILFLSSFFIIWWIIYYFLIKNNIDNDLITLYIITMPFVIWINFMDKKYKLIMWIITLPILLTLFYYLFFIKQIYNIFIFAYAFLSICLILLKIFDYIMQKIKNNPNLNTYWFADPYIVFILILFLWIKFVPYILIMNIFLLFSAILSKKKIMPFFNYIFFTFLFFIVYNWFFV